MAHASKGGDVLGRVLIADDEQAVRLALGLILKSHGYQVVEAVDGDDAVRKCRDASPPFDVLVLDLDMPRLDGIEAWRQIKQEHLQAKAIVLSGGINPLPVDCQDAVYLQKPFENQELIRLVRHMAGS